MKAGQKGYMVVTKDLERVGTVHADSAMAMDEAVNYVQHTGEHCYIVAFGVKVTPMDRPVHVEFLE